MGADPLIVAGAVGATAILAGAAVYGRVCQALTRQQQQIIYRPVGLCDGHDDHQNVVTAHDGSLLRGWIDNPGQPQALVYCGGSSESVELRREALEKAFPKHTRYIVPYRGFGPNAQFSPSETDIKKDAEELCRNLMSAYTVIDVVGRSLGTSVAAHISARFPIRKLALITPFDSILSIAKDMYRYVPVEKILRDRHEVWRDAPHIQARVLACLAEIDVITPHKFWHRLKSHFGQEPHVVNLEGRDHNSIAFSESMWTAIATFFEDLGDEPAVEPQHLDLDEHLIGQAAHTPA